jgi:FAD/FMN-containing dehydrogenase
MGQLDELRSACPALVVRTETDTLDAAGVDALRPFRARPDFAAVRTRPLAVAEPASTAEVAALMRWAATARVPLVLRGGGSGLMGAAAVITPAVVVSLARMAAVAVEPDACLVRAGAGATLARVDAALAPHGLLLGHDPWTAAVATVGGALSTNGLGYLGARAGSIGEQVRGLEVVLAHGAVIRMRPSPARSTGLDLPRLLIGTEGTLGIITEATLAVLPKPEERVVHGWTLPSFATGVSVAVAMRRQGIRPTSLELSGGESPTSELLLLFDGLRGEARLHAERTAELARAAGGAPLAAEAAERWWANRHAIAERWAANARFREGDWLPEAGRTPFDYAHVGVPLHALEAVRAEVHALVARHGVRLVEEGLWHWPELYSVVVTAEPDGAAGVRAVIDGICRATQDAGGVVEYCHGVGWKLAHLMEREHGPAALNALRRIKAALDPAGILNPGKGGL